jgi:hypothetical protein
MHIYIQKYTYRMYTIVFPVLKIYYMIAKAHMNTHFFFCRFFLNSECLCGVMQDRMVGPFLSKFNLRKKRPFLFLTFKNRASYI